MHRRDWLSCAGSAAFLAATLSPTGLLAQPARPQAGTEFLKLGTPVPTQAGVGKVEVIEFFWYNCPHCSAFEPTLDAWVSRLPSDVAFRRVPIAFQDSFVPQQRLYYALEAMGLVAKLHAKVFAAVHTQKQDLSKPETILDWVAKQGVDRVKFLEHFNSFSTSTSATRARQLQNAYRVEGVPAMGVAGRYYTDGSLASGMARVLQVVDYLVAETRSGR